jgi:hypothetical protein
MNGPEINQATNPNQIGLLASLEAPFFSDSDRIETLFLAALSRMPSDDEAKQFVGYLRASGTSQDESFAISDLLWILLNTAECAVCP